LRQRAVFYSLVSALIIAGLALSWMRYDQLDIPLIPKEQVPVWLIEARVDFDAIGESVTVRLSLPDEPSGFELLTEQSASPGYGFSLIEDDRQRRAARRMDHPLSSGKPEPLLQGTVHSD